MRFNSSTFLSLKAFITQGDKRSVNAKKNIVGSIAVRVTGILVQLMLVPITLGYLSSELYGIWLTASSIMLSLSFFDVGFTLGLKNRLAEAIAVDDFAKGKSLVSTTYFMLIIIFIPLGIAGEFIIPHVNWSEFLNVNEKYNEQLTQVMSVLMVSFCLQMIFNVISAVLAAFQKVAISGAFPVIANVISLIVIYVMTRTTEPSLLNMAVSISFLPIIVYILTSFRFYNGKFRLVSPSIRSIDMKYVKDLFSLGIKFFIIQLQIVILYQSANILISNLSSPEDVTSYNIAYKYMGVGSMTFTILLGPLWPAFTDAYVKKDFTWMRRVYDKMINICIIIFCAVILMAMLSPIVYNLWIGSKAMIPFAMTGLVGIYTILNTWNTLQVMLINGTGAVKLQSYVTMIGLIIHIPLSLLLGKYFNLGAYGVIVSMSIITLIYSSFFTIQIRKLISGKAIGIWSM